MEIKRKFEQLIVTKRRIVVHQPSSVTQTACPECGEPMLPIAQAAVLMGIKQSRVFRIIEADAAHFTETEAGELMICVNSVAAVSDGQSRERSEGVNESEE